MPQSRSPNAYPGVRFYMDRALQAENGVKYTFPDPQTAKRVQMQAYTVRRRQLDANKKSFPEGDPRRDNTIYDVLVFYRTTEDGTHVTSNDMSRGNVLVMEKGAFLPDSAIEEF